MAFFTLHVDRTVVELDHLARAREPEPVASRARDNVRAAIKPVEYPRQVDGRNSHASIVDRDNRAGAVRGRAEGDSDGAALGAVLDGVGQEIFEDPLDSHPINHGPHVG